MLTNKNILIISPQYWGKMFVSKHHYAVELARRNNKVYFLNPIDIKPTGRKNPIEIHAVDGVENLFYVEHRLWFPFQIKFHWIGLFHLLMKFHVRKLRTKIGLDFDIVWSFDLGNFIPLHFIPAKLYIFHPVDEPMNDTAIESACGAQILFSTTDEIRIKYSKYPIPSYKIQHGLSDVFLHTNIENEKHSNKIKVGISGNLTRKDIDRNTLVRILQAHPSVEFNLWGAYNAFNTNIGGGEDEETIKFIEWMQSFPNVIFHGPIPTEALAKALHAMDAFLICYHPGDEIDRGTNYHKILEYLSVGKVIVSSYVTDYHDKRSLIEMPIERKNDQLPQLFKKVMDSLAEYNTDEKIRLRKDYASSNTYSSQVDRIDSLLEKHFTTT